MASTTLYSIAISILLLLAQNANAQYVPIPESGVVWRELSWEGNSLDGGYLTKRQLFSNGDTVLNGVTYIKLYETGYLHYQEIHHPDTSIGFTNRAAGFYRNDSLNKKVFYIRAEDTTEHLLYDFNIQVGDTIPYTWYGAIAPIIVDSIDTIQIFGTNRRRFHLEYLYQLSDHHVFIEGVGSLTGFLAPLVTGMGIGTFELECFSVNDTSYLSSLDTLVYGGKSCWLYSDIENVAHKIVANIFPNPARNSLTITYDKGIQNTYLYVMNMLGNMIETQLLNSEGKIELNTSNYPDGIYNVMISGGNVHLLHNRFIILK